MPPSDLEEFGGRGAARYLPPRVTSLTFIIWPRVTVHRMGPSRVCLTKGVSEGLCWVGPTYRLSHPNPPCSTCRLGVGRCASPTQEHFIQNLPLTLNAGLL